VNALTRKGDFWSGLALAALGIYIISQAWGWDYLVEEGPGAGFFPLWYGAAMVIFSLLLVLGAVLKPGPAAPGEPFNWLELRRAMTCWLALAVCVALLKFLGFMLAFGLLTWFIVAVMFRRPQREALPIAIGGAVGFYALFAWALDLSLPVGTLFASLL
jgi:putative tricarboxylic transport membrane protein